MEFNSGGLSIFWWNATKNMLESARMPQFRNNCGVSSRGAAVLISVFWWNARKKSQIRKGLLFRDIRAGTTMPWFIPASIGLILALQLCLKCLNIMSFIYYLEAFYVWNDIASTSRTVRVFKERISLLASRFSACQRILIPVLSMHQKHPHTQYLYNPIHHVT